VSRLMPTLVAPSLAPDLMVCYACGCSTFRVSRSFVLCASASCDWKVPVGAIGHPSLY